MGGVRVGLVVALAGCIDTAALPDPIDPSAPPMDVRRVWYSLQIQQSVGVTGVHVRLFDSPGDGPCDATRGPGMNVVIFVPVQDGEQRAPPDSVRIRDESHTPGEPLPAKVGVYTFPRPIRLTCDDDPRAECQGVDLRSIRGSFAAYDATGEPILGASFDAPHCPSEDFEYWIGK